MIPGKVAALITRRIDDRTELCVFDHAGYVQLPAGTMEVGETPSPAAAREAWEETGLPRLELAGEVATLGEFDLVDDPRRAMTMTWHDGCPIAPGHAVLVHETIGSTAVISADFYGWTGEVDAGCVSRDVTRHVVHLRASSPAPDEWWVITPDGHGSQWRCRWMALDGDEGLHPFMQRWIDAGRATIDPGRAIERAAPLPQGSTELFWAPPFAGQRAACRKLERRPDAGEAIGSCLAAAITAGGDAVATTSDPTHGWGFPGGRHEPPETIEDTVAREVMEEACARVLETELLFSHEFRWLDDERNVGEPRLSPIFWARVELDEWAPQFETVARRLVPLADVEAELHWEAPIFRRVVAAARAAEARRR